MKNSLGWPIIFFSSFHAESDFALLYVFYDFLDV